MEIESEKKDKDIKETQNEKEIERLNRKLKRVMEEYAKCAKERDELRAAINAAERKTRTKYREEGTNLHTLSAGKFHAPDCAKGRSVAWYSKQCYR